jgi:hypothetical protein
MTHIFTFTIKRGAKLTSKTLGGVKVAPVAAEQIGELRGTGLYFAQDDGEIWRVSAKDVTGIRKAA